MRSPDSPNRNQPQARVRKCAGCGEEIVCIAGRSGRIRRYCSDRCRDAACREGRTAFKNLISGQTSGEPRNRVLTHRCEIELFLKNRNRGSICGPRHVLETECGGDWDEPFAREVRQPALKPDGGAL